MKKGDIVTGKIVKYDFPNIGTAEVTDDEGIHYVKIKNAVLGQTVEGMINKKKTNLIEARLDKVVEPAEGEIPSKCPNFGECGGCLYQTFPYEKQLEIKSGQVYRLIANSLRSNIKDLEEGYEGILGSPVYEGYRNKMEYSFGDEYIDGPLALGMHKRNSTYDVVNTFNCQIVDEDFRKIYKATFDYFTKLKLPYYHKMRHKGILRHLCIRKGGKSGEILVFLVTSSQWNKLMSKEEWDEVLRVWKDNVSELQLKGKIAGILHVKNDILADAINNEETTILYGKDYFEEEILGLKFKVSPFSFFQNNSLGAEILYSKVREYLLENVEVKPVVYDLYSGTGTIAQLVSPAAKRVIGVEIVEEAVEAARINAAANGIDNCEFIAGDVLKCLDGIETLPDYIILDPPRDGINPKALEKILDYSVEHIVYVSCKPSSLARDLDEFYAKGYRLKKMCTVDMFPATVHVETVVLLSQLRQKPDDYIDVDIDVAELEGTSAETKATYEKIKKYVAEHNDGMKVSSLNIAQIKRKCGLELAENFNLPKSENARQPQCPKEKEEAIVEALKAFQMI